MDVCGRRPTRQEARSFSSYCQFELQGPPDGNPAEPEDNLFSSDRGGERWPKSPRNQSLYRGDGIEERRSETVRKRCLENIVVAGARNFEKLYSRHIELCQGSAHF
jgi:hypothetical protein